MKKCPKCQQMGINDEKVLWKCPDCGKTFTLNCMMLMKAPSLTGSDNRPLIFCKNCGCGLKEEQKVYLQCESCGALISFITGKIRDKYRAKEQPVSEKISKDDSKSGHKAKKNSGKRMLIPAIISICLIIFVFVFIMSKGDLKKKTEELLVQSKYIEIEYLIQKNSMNEKKISIIHSVIDAYVTDLLETAAKGEITTDAVLEELNALSKINDYSMEMQLVNELALSKEAFAIAQKYEEKNLSQNAINQYKKVIISDTEYYELAQERIEKCTQAYINDQIENVQEYLSKDLYGAAIVLLSDLTEGEYNCEEFSELLYQTKEQMCIDARDKAKEAKTPVEGFAVLARVDKAYYSDGFSKIVEEAKEEAVNYVLASAQQMQDNKEYISGLNFLEGISTELRTKEVKEKEKEIKELYVLDVIEKAEKASNSSYDEAITILEASNKKYSHNLLSKTIEEYQEKKDMQFVKNVKTKYSIGYDKIEKDYFITVKGLSTDSVSLKNGRNVHPFVTVNAENGVALYGVYFGFVADDWIFIDDLIIDCDGKQFRWSVDYSDRITEVNGGKIAEACYFIHTEYSDIINRNAVKDFTELIDSLSKAETVTIRFRGDDGKKDITLPRGHVNELVDLFNLYLAFDRNETFVDYLK